MFGITHLKYSRSGDVTLLAIKSKPNNEASFIETDVENFFFYINNKLKSVLNLSLKSTSYFIYSFSLLFLPSHTHTDTQQVY